MNKHWQKLVSPDVATRYEVLQEPGRYRLRALDYQEIDLRTLSLAEADELVAKQAVSAYLKPRKVRRSVAATPGEKRGE